MGRRSSSILVLSQHSQTVTYIVGEPGTSPISLSSKQKAFRHVFFFHYQDCKSPCISVFEGLILILTFCGQDVQFPTYLFRKTPCRFLPSVHEQLRLAPKMAGCSLKTGEGLQIVDVVLPDSTRFNEDQTFVAGKGTP